MKIIGFSGVSGSGKSFRAPEVAASMNIKYIIDDGLLISEGRIIAGESAKKENTRLASVRHALFTDPESAREMKEQISAEKPSGILILGTSHSMIKRIADALEIGEVQKFVDISDVASEKEIETAIHTRRTQGKHVIPVPTFEIKKDFSGYWMDALKKLVRNSKDGDAEVEKSVVRPTFSYMGEFEITNNALTSLCSHAAMSTDGISRVVGCSIRDLGNGINVRIDVGAYFGEKLQPIGREAIKKIIKTVEDATSINVNHVTVRFKTLDAAKE